MDDLISRAAAIDAMTNTLWHYPNECYRNLNEYEFAKGLSELGLKSVPSAQPYSEADIQKMQELEQAELQKAYECGRASAQPEQRWIPVTERLPEDGKWCLFTDGVNSSVERYKADAMDHFFPEGRWFGLEDTVAWMPLPAPYTERREE